MAEKGHRVPNLQTTFPLLLLGRIGGNFPVSSLTWWRWFILKNKKVTDLPGGWEAWLDCFSGGRMIYNNVQRKLENDNPLSGPSVITSQAYVWRNRSGRRTCLTCNSSSWDFNWFCWVTWTGRVSNEQVLVPRSIHTPANWLSGILYCL